MNSKSKLLIACIAISAMSTISCSKETPAPEVQPAPAETPAAVAPAAPAPQASTPAHSGAQPKTTAKPKGDVFDQANDAIDVTNKTVTKTATVADRAAAAARRTDSILHAKH